MFFAKRSYFFIRQFFIRSTFLVVINSRACMKSFKVFIRAAGSGACMEKFVMNDGRMTFLKEKTMLNFFCSLLKKFCSLLKKFCSLLNKSLQAGLYRYQFSSLIKPITSALIKDSRAFIGESLKGMLFCLMHTDKIN